MWKRRSKSVWSWEDGLQRMRLIAREIEKDGKRVQCLMLETEHMTGKQVRAD